MQLERILSPCLKNKHLLQNRRMLESVFHIHHSALKKVVSQNIVKVLYLKYATILKTVLIQIYSKLRNICSHFCFHGCIQIWTVLYSVLIDIDIHNIDEAPIKTTQFNICSIKETQYIVLSKE